MTKRYFSSALTSTALACALTLAGCNQSPPSSSPSPAATVAVVTPTPEKSEFSAEVIKQAGELDAARDKEYFEYKLCKDEKNSLAFIYLASTAKVDGTGTLDAALQAMQIMPTGEGVPPSYHKAILKNLEIDWGAAQKYALAASKNSLKNTPDPEVLTKLLQMASQDQNLGAKVGSFDALGDYSKRNEDPKFLEVLLVGLNDYPPVACSALRTMNVDATRSDQAEKVKEALVALLTHEDPGVRGRAASKFGEVYYEAPEMVMETLSPMLKDPHPYVRGQAATGLSRVSSAESAQKIMSLLEDKEKTQYGMEFQGLSGMEYRSFGSQTSRVDTTALEALQALNFGKPKEEQFRYEFPKDEEKLDEHVAGQVKKAREWYAKVYGKK